MNKKFKPFYVIIIVLIIIAVGGYLKMGFLRNSSIKKMSAYFTAFTDTKRKTIELKRGDTITFEYNIRLKDGTLHAEFKDATGNLLESFMPNTSGSKVVEIAKGGIYEILIQGDNAKGSYKFEWSIE